MLKQHILWYLSQQFWFEQWFGLCLQAKKKKNRLVESIFLKNNLSWQIKYFIYDIFCIILNLILKNVY